MREPEPMLLRVRCTRCQMPLVQMYQGDVMYTLQVGGEQSTSRLVPVYTYRDLIDPAELVVCPRCGVVLSSATIAVVNPTPAVTNQIQPGYRRRGRRE